MIRQLFTEHPRSVDESYLQHLGAALGFAGGLALAALACLVHGVLPFLFVRTGSGMISDLHGRMLKDRQRRSVKAGAPPTTQETPRCVDGSPTAAGRSFSKS